MPLTTLKSCEIRTQIRGSITDSTVQYLLLGVGYLVTFRTAWVHYLDVNRRRISVLSRSSA